MANNNNPQLTTNLLIIIVSSPSGELSDNLSMKSSIK